MISNGQAGGITYDGMALTFMVLRQDLGGHIEATLPTSRQRK